MPEQSNINQEQGKRLLEQFPDVDAVLDPRSHEPILELMSNVLIYDRNSKTAYCYRCNSGVPYEKGFRHKKTTACPSCGMRVDTYALGRLKPSGYNAVYRSIDRIEQFVYPTVAEDGTLLLEAGRLMVRWEAGGIWDVMDFNAPSFPSQHWSWASQARYAFKRGLTAKFTHPTEDWSRWKLRKVVSEPFPKPPFYWTNLSDQYTFLMPGLVDESDLKYSLLNRLYRLTGYSHRGTISYLARYSKRPQFEMLIKMGFRKEVEYMMNVDRINDFGLNWKAKEPHKFFRLRNKAEFKLFINGRYSLATLDVFRSLCPADVRAFIKLEEIRKVSVDSLTAALAKGKELNIPPIKVLKYLNDTQKHSCTAWLDYIRECRQLNMDLISEAVSLPDDLNRAHERTMRMVQLQSLEDEERKYEPLRRQLERRYAFKFGSYEIIVPRNSGEIIAEGEILRHCVGGYAQRHIEGAVVILFLRNCEERDKSLVTIEMKGAKIVQIHGYRNDAGQMVKPREQYRDLLNTWLEWLADGSRRNASGDPIIKQNKIKEEAS